VYYESSFEAGDLVRWYENYHDLMAAKNSGLGIIVTTRNHQFNNEVTHVNYGVYRHKHADIVYFDSINLEKLNRRNEC